DVPRRHASRRVVQSGYGARRQSGRNPARVFDRADSRAHREGDEHPDHCRAVHDRPAVADELGDAAAVRPRFDPRRAYITRIHPQERHARSCRHLRADGADAAVKVRLFIHEVTRGTRRNEDWGSNVASSLLTRFSILNPRISPSAFLYDFMDGFFYAIKFI